MHTTRFQGSLDITYKSEDGRMPYPTLDLTLPLTSTNERSKSEESFPLSCGSVSKKGVEKEGNEM